MYPSQHTCCQCWALRDPISEKIAIFILYFSEKKSFMWPPHSQNKSRKLCLRVQSKSRFFIAEFIESWESKIARVEQQVNWFVIELENSHVTTLPEQLRKTYSQTIHTRSIKKLQVTINFYDRKFCFEAKLLLCFDFSNLQTFCGIKHLRHAQFQVQIMESFIYRIPGINSEL